MHVRKEKRPLADEMAEQIGQLTQACEHYTEACCVSLDLLGELIPKVSPVEQTAIYARLGVIEDILGGAVTRYTD